MALVNKNFLEASGAEIFYKPLRAQAGPGPGAILTRVFGPSAGAELLPQLTPVAQVDGDLIVWSYIDGSFAANTSEVIVGFVWTEEVQLSATGQTNGNIMAIGEVDYRDVPIPENATGTQQQLEDALGDVAVRQRNLTITGGLTVTL